MEPIPFILDSLAGGILGLAFFVAARMRLRSMLGMFAWQSFLLSVFAGVAAMNLHEPHLFITGAITVILKTWFIPWFLIRTAERSGSGQRLHSYVRPATTLLSAALLVLIGFFMTRSLVPLAHPDYLVAASSVSTVLIGFLMLIVRRDMYGQIIGFLLMENGIFTFGLTLTGGMPLLVELGIFFDIAIGAVLMAALSYLVQKELETVRTDTLTDLVD